MSQQGYIGRNPGDGRTIVNRQTTHVTTGVQTSFTMTAGYEIGYLDVYLNGIKQTETLDYTASDGSTINFALSYPPVNGDVLEFVAFETLNITNIKSARRNFTVGQDLDVTGNVTIGSSLTVASDLVVNGTFTTINTEILDVEDKTVGIASTSSPSNTTADGAGIVIYGGSDGDKSITWNTDKSNFVIVGGGVSIGTGVTISTPAANVLAFSVNSAEKARFNNFGAFTVGYEGEAWHESTYVGVLQAGSGAWIGQTPGASARAEWVNNAYYDSVNTRWEYIAADEANRIVLENGELKVQSADAGSADGAITWNEKLKMTVGGDFKIGAPTGIGVTISSSGNIDAIGITTVGGLTVTGNITANGNITGDGSTDISGINDATVSMLSISDTITHTGDTDTKLRFPGNDIFTIELSGTEHFRVDTTATRITDKLAHIGDPDTMIRFPAADTFTVETAGSERLRIDSSGHMGLGITPSDVDSIGKALNIASSTGGAIYLQDTDSPTVKFGAISYNGATAALQIHAHHASSYIDLGTNGTERFRIGSSGQLGIGGATYGSSGQVLTSGGSGSAPSWTTITGTTINNNANNRVITGSGTANTLEGESELTFGGSILAIQSTTSALGARFTNTADQYTNLQFSANRTSARNALGIINAKWNNTHEVASIYLQAGDDTTNKDDGIITFYTKPSGGNIASRLVIQDNGNIDIPANTRLRIGDSQEIQIYDDGNDGFIQKTGTGGLRIDSSQTVLRDDQGDLYIQCVQNGATSLYHNGNLRFETNTDATTMRGGGAHRCEGHFRPFANDTYDLGTSSDRWRNIYTTDLQLSNEGKTNDVDGTWGNYTIQEGESDLFLINNRSGKKYKFNLTEVN